MKHQSICIDLIALILRSRSSILLQSLVFLLGGVISLSTSVFASEDATKDIPDSNPDFQIGVITVTAQKQEENVQEVPVSMTVLNNQSIEDAKIETILDLGDYLPNFHVFETGNSAINVPTTRGIYAPMESGTVTTGLYVDGIPALSPTGYDAGLYDIERVEFLRGPQGTLYGKGAEAGVINIITRNPNNMFSSKVTLNGGNWLSSEADNWVNRASFNVSGPILEDKLFYGISSGYERKDGFILNTNTGDPQNDRSNLFGKGTVRWLLTDRLALNLIASRMEYDDTAGQQSLSRLGATKYGVSYPGHRNVRCNLDDQYYKMTQDLQALKIDYAFSDYLSFTSITTHWNSRSDMLQDWDFTEYTLQHTDVLHEIKRISEELRLNYANGRFIWLIGAYYDTAETVDKRSTESIMPSLQSATHRINSGDSQAVFGQLTYPLNNKLSLTAGVRFETENKDFEDKYPGVKRSESWNDVSPKISAEYAFSSKSMAYVSIAKGYRSGGFNLYALTSDYYTYDPEILWSYEVGMKTALLGNKLVINGAAFYMNIEDMQVTETKSDGMAYLVNATEATSQGIEFDLTYNPFNGLTFIAGYGYTDVVFGSFSDAAGDYTGNQGPWSPEYTYNLSGQYRYPGGWYARVDLIGYGKTFFDKDNKYFRDPYDLVNAKIGFEGNNLDIYLYGKNILDKTYDAVNVWGGVSELYSEPGEIGLQVAYRF